MTLRNLAAASLAALALAACGDDNDNNTKPITPDTPSVPEACKALKCTLQTEGEFKGSFVTKNDKGEITAVWDAKGTQTHKLGKDGKLQKIEKPDDGKKPGTAGEFDLSGEGVTEPLKEPVRGGSNYLRGSNSTFDVGSSKPNISSIAIYGFDEGNWNEAMDNFVAVNPDKDKDKNSAKRALFEDILKKNKDTAANHGSDNTQDNSFNAPAATDLDPLNKVVTGTTSLGIGEFYKETKSNIEMKINGTLGSGIDPLANGSLPYTFDFTSSGIKDYKSPISESDNAWAQEENDLTSGTSGNHQNGGHPTRLYGAKVWDVSTNKYNFTVIKNFAGVENILGDAFATQMGVADGLELPTAVKHDLLKHVQFGRLSGLAEPGKLYPATGYVAKDLMGIPFADAISNAVVSGGQSNATDFYFSRGNNPTALDKMKALKSDVITYHGQALTYGLDNRYHGPQSADGSEKKGSIPNSVKGLGGGDGTPTLLGGRGNFVVAQFAPDQGKVQGSVYNVWNIADILPVIENGKITKFHTLKTTGGEFDTAATAVETTLSAKSYKNVRGYKDNLISFSGAVNGNKIEGDAIRYDNEKGKFAGAFFGDGAEEMAGVISSAVEYNGKQPNYKWGAVFGAKAAEVTKPGQALPGIPSGPGHLGWSLEKK